MMLKWMSYAMLTAAALGVAAWLIDFAVAGRFARRRLLWAVVFFASAVGPVVLSVTRLGDRLQPVPNMGEFGDRLQPVPLISDRVLISAWLAMSAVFALSLVATQLRLRRRLRGCRSSITGGERVLVSSNFGPAVIGVVRTQIVLPEWALAMRESERRIIVAHETEHRNAHDPLLAAMALMVIVALPWNAALWWQLRRLRLAIEIDCDRRVVSRRGHDPHAYGMLLLATRERASRVTPMLAMAMAMAMAAMRSGLGRRVEALMDGGASRSAMRRLSAVVAAGLLAAGAIVVPAPRLSIVGAGVVHTPVAPPPRTEPALRVIRRGSTVEARWVTPSGATNRRLVQPRTAPNRRMLLPDSVRRSPR